MEYEALVLLIAKELNIKPERIHKDSKLSDLGADSLDVFQILIGIEEVLQTKIAPEAAEKLRTVGDVWNLTLKVARP
ncbi:MAG: acyl carrier protein [Lachnospiraceae bacterium]|jgi:acyl carrier protein|nr:acyl carrier protein [Lachnospiraceae bacterium]MBR3509052.1 acyl carrier protein [Lachnospiraceae bacterium]MBR4608708.1 acyl carrier protein [Lachnospiraceae bacterium]MBR6152276.1 acyl carrier protein [Lachnospiraceae bacterium]